MNTTPHRSNSVPVGLLKLAAVLSLTALAQPPAHAGSGTWNATSSGLWSNTANWLSGTVADGSGFTATFSANLTSDVTVGLDSARTIQALSFSDTNTATPGSWILGNNGNAANTLTMNGTNPGITVNALGAGSTATVSLQLSGTQGVRKFGTGTLVLTNGANNFSGQLIGGSLNWGTIRVADSTVYGAGNQSITSTIMGTAGASISASGGRLDLRYNGQNDTTAQTLSMAAASGALTLTGVTTTINVDRESGTGTNKTIAMGNFTTSGNGTLNVTGSNGYNLRIGGNVVLNNGNSPTFNPTTANLTIAGSWSGFGTNNRTVTLDGTSAGNVISGNITNSGSGAAVLSLVKSNSSTWVLGGNNTYNGTAAINSGALNIQNANALGNTAAGTTVASGAALQLQGGISVGAEALTLSGDGVGSTGALRNISGNNSYAGAITLNAATRINSDAGNLNLSGGISGAGQNLTVGGAGNTTISGAVATTTGSLAKDGAGTLTLLVNNTYTGATTINSGNISFSTTAALASTSGVNLANATALIYNGSDASLDRAITVTSGTGTIRNSGTGHLTLSGALSKNGTTLTLAGGTNGITVSGVISGSSPNSDLVIDGGTTTLTNANNAYNGPTFIINSGTLNANTAGALPTSTLSAVTINGNSTLALGASQSVASLSGTSGSTVNLNANTLTINGSSATTYSGGISGTGNLVKNGSGTQTLAGATTFNGTTTVNSGTLTAAAAGAAGGTSQVVLNEGGSFLVTADNAVNDSAAINLNGGRMAVSGNFDETVGLLTLSANSTIDFSGFAGTLRFGGIGSWATGATLAIWNWSGTTQYGTQVNNYANPSNLVFTSNANLTSENLALISFYSDSGSSFVGNGFEQGFSPGGGTGIIAVPEPEALFYAAALLAGVVIQYIRRTKRDRLQGQPPA